MGIMSRSDFTGKILDPEIVPRGAEHKAFIDDVLANPDDKFLRLIYADWMEENGYEDAAFFMRMPGFTQSFPYGCETKDKSGATYRFAACEMKWVHGFVEEIKCSPRDWFAHAQNVIALHPIQVVDFTEIAYIARFHDYYRYTHSKVTQHHFKYDVSHQTALQSIYPRILFQHKGRTIYGSEAEEQYQIDQDEPATFETMTALNEENITLVELDDAPASPAP